MKALARVVWSEGMHLAQHHFQAQSAYFEDVATATLSSLFYSPYGLLSLQLDDEALLNGTAVLIAAQGIMPDGVPFSFPDDTVPEPLRVADLFSPTEWSHLLLLALPRTAPGRASVAPDTATERTTRFSAVQRNVADETTGLDARPVQFARKNFQLLLDSDLAAADHLTMPIARVQREGGRFRYDPAYVGPCLRISASRYLRELVGRVAGMLQARANAVAAERATSGGERAEYASREIANFWFLHALNTALPLLRHWQQTGGAHPEQLYLHLAQLAGALCTFSLTSSPADVPPYDHDAPEQCFAQLERHIQRHLDIVQPPAPVKLALEPTQQGFYRAAVSDTRCFEPAAQWYLGVRSGALPADVVTHVKVCSAQIIGWLAQKAFAGLTLEHVPVPPPDLSPRVGMHYFLVRRTEPCWKSVVDTREVGLYVPGVVADPELELKVIIERRGT